MRPIFKNLFHNFFHTLNLISGNFVSFVTRPINSSEVVAYPREINTPKKFAIIIQGPLKLEKSFTLETVLLYKKTLLSSTQIIISTWSDEDENILKKLKGLGVHVVTATKPKNSGISNINYQITSVKNALAVAKNLNVEFVLKTRTDIRIYAPNIEEYLCGLLESFPPRGAYKQKYRILGLSLNSFMYRLYSLSDLVIFGQIDDMTNYWDLPLEPRAKEPARLKNTLREWAEMRMVETYLTTSYLEKIGRTLEWTMADSFLSLADNFIIIDEQSLDLFWYKYEHYKEYKRRNYSTLKNDLLITFRDWLTIYADNNNIKNIPEHVLDLPFESKIN